MEFESSNLGEEFFLIFHVNIYVDITACVVSRG